MESGLPACIFHHLRRSNMEKGFLCQPPWTAAACCRLRLRSLLRPNGMGTHRLDPTPWQQGCFTESYSRL